MDNLTRRTLRTFSGHIWRNSMDNGNNNESEVIGIKEISIATNYSDRQIRRFLKAGLIKGGKLNGGRKWIIPKSEIERVKNLEAIGSPLSKYKANHSGESVNLQNKNEHFDKMAEIAQNIVGVMNSLEPQKDGTYIYDWADKTSPLFLEHQEIIDWLLNNIEKARWEFGSFDMFDYFLLHVIPEKPNIDGILEYAKTRPIELIDKFKLLVLRKDFKGTCPVCEGLEKYHQY